MSTLVKVVVFYLLLLALFCILCVHGAVEEYPERDWDGAFLDELSDVTP